MERLRVLRALLPAAVDDGANGERHRHLPAEHVAPLRRLVDDLVHCEHREIDSRMDDYRALAAQGCAQSGAGAGQLRHRCVDDAVATKLDVETGHCVADVPRAPQTLTDRKDVLVGREQICECFPDSEAVTRHVLFSRLVVHAIQ